MALAYVNYVFDGICLYYEDWLRVAAYPKTFTLAALCDACRCGRSLSGT